MTETFIRSAAKPTCPCCGEEGPIVYTGMRDRLFGAPGEWSYRRCSNQQCESFWMDPCPIEEDLHLAYATYYTHSDGTGAVVSTSRLRALVARLGSLLRRTYMERAWGYPSVARGEALVSHLIAPLAKLDAAQTASIDFLVRHQPAHARGRLLDLGCGGGDAIAFLNRVGWRAEGADVDDAAMSHARSKGLRVHAMSDLEDAAFEGAYDVVSASHVIEHVFSIQAFLAQARRLLKPGGTLVLMTPNANGKLTAEYGASALAFDVPRHLVVFSPASLTECVRRGGFEVSSVTSTARDFEGYRYASTQIARKGAHRWGDVEPDRVKRVKTYVDQWRMQRDIESGRAEGDELVLIARKPGA